MPDDPKPPAFANVPRIQPGDFDDYGVFRETFLAEVHDEKARSTYRAYGILQQNLVREGSLRWPYRQTDVAAHQLQAVLADLRHLQGYLAFHLETVDEAESEEASGGHKADAMMADPLWKVARRLHQEISVMADELDRDVGGVEVKRTRP